MINKEKLKRRFSRNAKHYDQYAHVQKIMGDHLLQTIDINLSVQNILEIGCGTGYVTQQLISRFPNAKITAVDIAPRMIEQAQKKLGRVVNFICCDIEDAILSQTYDLILSNATFQWLNHFDETFYKLMNSLSAHGQLHFSTFGDQTFSELRTSFEAISIKQDFDKPARPSQNFFKATELMERCHSIINISTPDFKLGCEEYMEPEFFPSCKDFLMSVKKIGANDAQENRNKVTPDFIEAMMDFYDHKYQTKHGVKATYHTLYFQIKKTTLKDND